jgi:hypothetical protein
MTKSFVVVGLSLSVAMGLTTIVTNIWVCPPKYVEVQDPYF